MVLSPRLRRRWPTLRLWQHRLDVVRAKLWIRRKDRDGFQLCLRDDQAVERITMMRWERSHAEGMCVNDRQWTRGTDLHARWNVLMWRCRQGKLSQRLLDRDFPRAGGGEKQLGLRLP